MATTHPVRRRETHKEAVCRLADQAAQRGVQIYRTPDGRHWATSISSPGALHYVTGFSCDCPGFLRHQRCTHHAALLASLGWLPGAPEPTTPAPALPASSRGLSNADVIMLKADAMKRHVLHGEALVNPLTGEIIAPAA